MPTAPKGSHAAGTQPWSTPVISSTPCVHSSQHYTPFSNRQTVSISFRYCIEKDSLKLYISCYKSLVKSQVYLCFLGHLQ